MKERGLDLSDIETSAWKQMKQAWPLSEQSEDDFERNKVAHMQIELSLSLFLIYFPLWKQYTVLLFQSC